MFTTRNVTHNGTPSSANASCDRSKVDAKCRELEAKYPGVTFEVVELVAKTVTERVFKPGRGRAGNSYPVMQSRTVWQETRGR